ncbi:MAG: glycosyltransferase family 39 protein [Elusimicrobiota bacterium]|jgi:hypothetical protein
MTRRMGWGIASLLLTAHLLFSLHAARHLSPAWDEIVYPSAGVAQWQTRSITRNREHPFLAKLISSFPLLPLRPARLEFSPTGNTQDDYRAGFSFTFHNRLNPKTLIFWSRVPAVVCSVLAGALLFGWMSASWGVGGGLISLLCYLATPIFLSRASLALLEAPMYLFILLALWCHSRWMENREDRFLYASGASTGLALLCKLSALPLVFTFLALQLLNRRQTKTTPIYSPVIDLLKLLGSTALVVFLAYLPWSGAWEAFRASFVNVFVLFNRPLPYYWHGQTYKIAPAYLSWAAWLIKAPLCVIALGLWGAFARIQNPGQRAARQYFMIFAGACLIPAFFFGSAVSSVHFSPVYLAIAGLAAGVASRLQGLPSRAALGVLLVLAWVDVYRVHPNYLSYFNEMAGGPRQGYRWMEDSDQDWGQSLPALAHYWEKEGRPGLILCYSGAGDPRAEGLVYQDLYSPALVSREYQGELIAETSRPVYLAIATKVMQSAPEGFAWPQAHLQPKALVSNCFFIYDITRQPEAFRWMGTLYYVTQRGARAQWAFDQAARMDRMRPSPP